MTLDNIEKVAILIELDNGSAHQLLISKENKNILLHLISSMEGGIKLSPEIMPVTFDTKPKP